MTERGGAAEGGPDTGLPTRYIALLALFLLCAFAAEVLLVRSFSGLGDASRGYNHGTQAVTLFGDVHRDALKLREAVLVNDDLGAEDVQVRRDLLSRQIHLLVNAARELRFLREDTQQDVLEFQGHLDTVDRLRAEGGPEARDLVLAELAELDRHVRGTASQEEVEYVGRLRTLEAETRRTRLALAVVSAITLLLGIGLAWAISQRYRSLYARAYDRLSDEMRVRRQREEQLEQQAEQLVQYAAEMEATNEALRIADATKNDFVSTVSHELRTPLTAIRGFAQTLELRWDDMGDEQRFGLVVGIERQGRRQQRLIDDLLTVSRMVAGTLEAHTGPVDVRRAAKASVETTQLAGVDLDIPADTVLAFDGDHLVQILTNLLTNADKYGGGTIRVRADVDGDVAHLRVSDEGTGIDQEFVPRLFERFEQASTGDRRTSAGLGLGLAISRDLAELNQGELRYEDAPGGGACFVLTAPLHRATNVSTPTRQAAR